MRVCARGAGQLFQACVKEMEKKGEEEEIARKKTWAQRRVLSQANARTRSTLKDRDYYFLNKNGGARVHLIHP